MNSLYDESPFLEHHGIKGQKWGVRRFQNPDGTLTAAGKKRYLKLQKKTLKDFSKTYKFGSDNTAAIQTLSKRSDARNELKRLIEAKNKNKKVSEKEYVMSKRLAKEMFGFDNPEDVEYSGVLSKKEKYRYYDEYNKRAAKLKEELSTSVDDKYRAAKAFSAKLFNTVEQYVALSLLPTEKLEELLKEFEKTPI